MTNRGSHSNWSSGLSGEFSLPDANYCVQKAGKRQRQLSKGPQAEKLLFHELKTGLEVSVPPRLITENEKGILLTLQTLWRQSVVTGW